MKRFAGLLLCLLVAATSSSAPAQDSSNPPLMIDPSRIEIDSFYAGVPVRIEGAVAPGAEVVVAIRGSEEDESFNKKVRAGPIWISSGKVHISGAPSLFLLHSAKPLSEVLGREAIDAHVLDDEAIMGVLHVDAGGDEVDEDAMRRNYVDMKLDAHVYQTLEASVEIAANRFSLNMDWPKEAPPGKYEVIAYQCQGGSVVSQQSATLELLSVGFPAQIHAMALDSAALYGALAVLLAVFAGFFIDFVVSRLFGTQSKVKH